MTETGMIAICLLVGICAWIIFFSEHHVRNPFINVQNSENENDKPRDCQDIRDLGHKETGIYKITPAGTIEVRVRCEMNEATGAWTVIQRRVSDSDFYKTWAEYIVGFGDLNRNFWLGNQHINHITTQGLYKLRIDMTNSKGESRYAEYFAFSVGDVSSRFKLFVDGYSGNAGDSLTYHNGYRFSTKDVDHDGRADNCAVTYKGGWWYWDCHQSNLNGMYGNSQYGQGMNWIEFTGYYSSLTSVTMKVQRWTQNA